MTPAAACTNRRRRHQRPGCRRLRSGARLLREVSLRAGFGACLEIESQKFYRVRKKAREGGGRSALYGGPQTLDNMSLRHLAHALERARAECPSADSLIRRAGPW
jgi:hypothetical protein